MPANKEVVVSNDWFRAINWANQGVTHIVAALDEMTAGFDNAAALVRARIALQSAIDTIEELRAKESK